MQSWRDYHELTKHTPERLRTASPALDWANMPDLFRHYAGVPVLDLPADPPEPGMPPADGPESLSQLLFYSAANSATKETPTGRRYALRVNPSSGNLHPTEFHFVTGGLQKWPDGVYHYRPSDHMAEQRATAAASPGIQFILTSITWREAWKYGDRAYRYCLLDAGHAAEALRLAAHRAGHKVTVEADIDDSSIAQALNLPPDEWPLVVVQLGEPMQWQANTIPNGTPNRLSENPRRYESIEAIHSLTSARSPWTWRGSPATAPSRSRFSFGQAARTRRSALDFTGAPISQPELAALLAHTHQDRISLYLYIHRVEGMVPGVYRYDEGQLTPIRIGDQRVAVAGLCLRQDLAGNAAFAISMIGSIAGNRAYRYAHFEAGAIGQRLYLTATALGLGATGIGGFFDDAIHEYLAIPPDQGQVLYNFAVGHPIPDTRLTP